MRIVKTTSRNIANYSFRASIEPRARMQEQNEAMSEIMGEILCNPGHARLFYILKFVPVGHERLKDVIIRVRL